MEAKYDSEVDVLRISWSDAEIEESDSVSPGIILDYDSARNVIGIEVLNASKKIQHFNLKSTDKIVSKLR
ncbi:DUF2283 domain-containing protein [Crocosphaera sp. UHCC 0190]|uniref:DUF2283 domain-containing protein n=1 Tax=unclassified Crocosphaera TaxID=2623705 RepID=UPI002B1F7AA7|nr:MULTISPECIES: DUF2283 domain-containing protein [unclassified Crocosphaera]MEA5509313.1 DUF2283 domain-containing protein [Crocosphaera sp. UHCC 0190]MEA5533215.1 DUF2283 domain-containing protein [Crocosphaera sp. XPORK-15E]